MRENKKSRRSDFSQSRRTRSGGKKGFAGYEVNYSKNNKKSRNMEEPRGNYKDILIGRNPALEALKSGRDIEYITVQKGATGSIGKILSLAKERGIVIRYEEKMYMDNAVEGSHQGVIVKVSAHSYVEIDEILTNAEEKGEPPFIIVLDGVEDPHNIGSIMRSAECLGAHGIIIAKRRAGGLNETVAKTSAGAIEYLPCARVTNIGRTLENLKEKGLWVYACDMDGEPCYNQSYDGGIALVIGNEGKGISKLVKEKCDITVSIPMTGNISSLNASNAASILMYEISKKRQAR